MKTDTPIKDRDIEDLMLTTTDNPFNPKEEYDKWRQWDVDNMYHTEEYLARIVQLSDDVDLDNELQLEALTTQAVYSILENDVLGVYKLV